MRKHFFPFSRLVLLFVPAVVLVAQAEHITACTGIWKLNIAKLIYPPGMAPQSLTLRFTPDGKNIVSGIDGKGKPFEWAIRWSDGKEVRIEGIENATGAQTIRSNSLHAVLKEGGKTVMTIEDVLSPDGKAHTGTITHIDEKGHRTQHTEFYDKQ